VPRNDDEEKEVIRLEAADWAKEFEVKKEDPVVQMVDDSFASGPQPGMPASSRDGAAPSS
jgi:hypothetical protein